MKWQAQSKRKLTGGRVPQLRRKRKFEMGRTATEPTIGERRCKKIQGLGTTEKMRLFKCDVANVTDPKTGVTKKAKIETVLENPANLHYVRRNILTKGAIIKTELGKARITNRPAQDGVVNAVLIE
ncbi:MAG: 30S ribosomal protein S8e [Methanocellales archaeon]